MFRSFKKFIQQHQQLGSIEWKIFEARLSIKQFKTGEIVLHQGDICEELYFIDSGLARAFIIDEDGKDYTWSIFFNDENAQMSNLFVTDYDSFLHQKGSSMQIEAIEDTTLITAKYQDVQFVYNKLKKGERFGRLMAEEAYGYLHSQIISRQTKSAKERFDDFVSCTPYLLDKVPQYHIATFLGITPQHLSRLKKECKINICE